MGVKQSALKKEVAALQQEARKRSAKHQEELAEAAKEKRLLQLKVDELYAMVTQAQEEAEKTKSEAREREERTKALKWELARQLRLTGSPTSSSPRASLSPSSSTRIALNWRLNDDVSLHQSVVSPKKTPNDTVVSDNRETLLAPHRSLIKRSEAAAATGASTNQIPDADAKETSKTSATAVKSTVSSVMPSESKSSSMSPLPEPTYNTASDVKDVSKSRGAKSESSSDDPPATPANSSDDEAESPPHPSKPHLPTAESKDSDDDSPETNTVLQFSEDDSNSS